MTKSRRLSARYDLHDTSLFLSSTSSPQVIPTLSLVGGMCLLFCLSDVDTRDSDGRCDISGRRSERNQPRQRGGRSNDSPWTRQDKPHDKKFARFAAVALAYIPTVLCSHALRMSERAVGSTCVYADVSRAIARTILGSPCSKRPGCTQLVHRTSGAAAAAKSPLTLAASVPRSAGPDSNRRTHHIGGSKGRWPP